MEPIQPSLRDFGNCKLFPALKCRAIVIASLRDGQTPFAFMFASIRPNGTTRQ